MTVIYELPPIINSNQREGQKYYGRDICNPIQFAIQIRDGVQNIMAAITILNPRLLFNCFRRGVSKYYDRDLLPPPSISNSIWRGGLKYYCRTILPPPPLVFNSNRKFHRKGGSKYFRCDILNHPPSSILIGERVQNIMDVIY